MKNSTDGQENTTPPPLAYPMCTGYKKMHIQQGADLRRWTINSFVTSYAYQTLGSLLAGKACEDWVQVTPTGGITVVAFIDYQPVRYPVGLLCELLDDGIEAIELFKATRLDDDGSSTKYDLLLKAGNDYYDLSIPPVTTAE